jgi:hypothetical protein
LLTRDPTKRLGSANVEADEILQHPFFKDINWVDLRAGKSKPPFKPNVKGPDDVSCIDKMFLDEKVQETPDQSMTGSKKRETNFKGFTYN